MAKQQIKENQLVAFNRCSIYRNSDLTSLVQNACTSIPFTDEDFDANDMHSTSSQTERITIKESGWYDFGGVARFSTMPTNCGIKVVRYNSSGTVVRGGGMVFYGSATAI